MTTRLRCRPPYDAWACSWCDAPQDRPPPQSRRGLVCQGCTERGAPPGEPFIPLTISPRRPAPLDARPIIAVVVERDTCLTEDGEVFGLAELVTRLRERAHGTNRHTVTEQIPPAIIVTDNARDLLGYLENTELADSPFWQWRVAARPRSVWREGEQKRHTVDREVPCYFGWASKGPNGERRAKGRSRYYQLLDPMHFNDSIGRTIDATSAVELLAFARQLREWCNRQGIRTPSYAAAISAALLRDKRFFPEARRKVPEATNRRVRPQLPGNHYQLLAPAGRTIREAHKIDLRSAHHTAALRTRFPDPDTLEAIGFFRGWLPDDGEPADSKPRSRFLPRRHTLRLLRRHGLFCLAINVRRKCSTDPLELPCLKAPGRVWRYVWSPEVPRLLELDRRGLIRIEGMIAGWCSPDVHEGLSEYAAWSLGELQATPDAHAWLKPTLLATYGLLAAPPRKHGSCFKWSKAREEHLIVTHRGDLFGKYHETKRERPSLIANVVCRGMIEAETRCRVLDAARTLREQGAEPLAIYADSIFLARRPTVPVGFRYEGVRHGLTFYDSSHYASREETKLPGIARRLHDDARSRLERFQALRRDTRQHSRAA